MKKIEGLLNNEGIKYIIFGGLTTGINIASYLFFNKLGIQYVVSNTLAFILSIIFAFITNKLYVFQSKVLKIKVVIREIITFLGARLVTYIIDTVLLIILIEKIHINDFMAKITTNIIVITINYVLSKFIIFKN